MVHKHSDNENRSSKVTCKSLDTQMKNLELYKHRKKISLSAAIVALSTVKRISTKIESQHLIPQTRAKKTEKYTIDPVQCIIARMTSQIMLLLL